MIPILFLTGCTGMPVMDTISNVFTAKSVADTIGPDQQTTKVVTIKTKKEQKFFGSNHNWNNTEEEPTTTKENVVEDTSSGVIEEIETPKKERSLPWPLLIIFLLSGIMYFINRIVINKQMREENVSN